MVGWDGWLLLLVVWVRFRWVLFRVCSVGFAFGFCDLGFACCGLFWFGLWCLGVCCRLHLVWFCSTDCCILVVWFAGLFGVIVLILLLYSLLRGGFGVLV